MIDFKVSFSDPGLPEENEGLLPAKARMSKIKVIEFFIVFDYFKLDLIKIAQRYDAEVFFERGGFLKNVK
jgi:hypothetical protein